MYLLDTNLLSEMRKIPLGRANANVEAWSKSVALPILFISVISLLEIRKGILLRQRSDPGQARLLQDWFERDILEPFAERILPIDAEMALKCAELHIPDPRPDRDAFLAATALIRDFVVVTRNTADFERSGIRLLNPWL